MLSVARMVMCRGVQVAQPFKSPYQFVVCRSMAQDTRSNFASRLTRGRGPSLKERALAPTTGSAFEVGRIALAGGSVLGIGALCYYGLGMADEQGAIERAMFWPKVVQQRIKDTYLYFAGSVCVAVGSAAAVIRSPRVMALVSRNSWPMMLGSIAVMVGTQMLARSIPYEPGVNMKHLTWALHAGVLGAVIAPISILGGAILLRAAWYTAGVVGGLSAVAVCAPSEKFLYMGGPLAVGLGIVFAASIGTLFLPPTTAMGAGLASISLYGGLLLFSAFLLYDTQKIVKHCEQHPVYSPVPFDPINHSMNIFIDAVNIFIRIATILAGGGSRKK